MSHGRRNRTRYGRGNAARRVRRGHRPRRRGRAPGRGTAYDIGFADGAWHACRLDGNGTLITSAMPYVLNAAIRADWTAP